MNDQNETTDADWQELDASEDVTDGEPMQGEGEGEEVEEVASDVDAAIYLAQQESARDAFFGQQPQYRTLPSTAQLLNPPPGYAPPGYESQQQPQGYAPPGYPPPGYESQQQPQGYAPPAGAPPEYFAPFEPPAEPAYPPQPGAPYGADENGIPYLPPNNPSPDGPPGGKRPFDYSNLGNILKNHPLIFPPGPESYDGQWRIATMWMAPDPAEYTANGYVLETSVSDAGAGRLQFPSWRLVLDSQSSSDTPEAEPPRAGTHTPPGPFGDLDAAFAGLRIGAPARAPVALVRPTSSASTPRSAPSAPKAPTSSKPGARPFIVTAPSTKALPARPTSRGVLPAVPLAVRRAPLTTVIKTPGLAKAIVRLPNGAKAAKIQIRPLPRGSVALKTPANAYDGRWHDAKKEKPPSSPRPNMRLVQRSSAAGAIWRFIPRLRPGAAALRPGVRPALRPGARPALRPRISGMDPNDPRENIAGNPAGSSSGLTPAGAMLVPVSFLTDVQRSRQPAIIGGCACVRSSEMDDSQRQRVGDFWGDFQRGFSTVDHAIDQGWQVARPFVPYGDTIDAVHRARMGLMYGDQGAGAARGASDQAISSAQSLTRRARKGDASAQAQLVQLKEAAARGDANAIRTWRVVVLVSRDDDARIANGDAPSSSASGSGSSSSANPLGSLLSSVARR